MEYRALLTEYRALLMEYRALLIVPVGARVLSPRNIHRHTIPVNLLQCGSKENVWYF